MTHTPTPWRAITNESGRTFEEIYEIRNEHGKIACYVPFPEKDTAAFIVKAVNSHDILLKACYSAFGFISHYERCNGDTFCECGAKEMRQELKAAIIKAEGSL